MTAPGERRRTAGDRREAHDAGHIRHFKSQVRIPGSAFMTVLHPVSHSRHTRAFYLARWSQAHRSDLRGVAIAGVLASRDAGPIPFNPNAKGASQARQHRDPLVPGELS